MKQFSGFTGERSKKGYPMLPAGPYVGKIMNVKLDGLEPDQTLILLLDVTEGDHISYYAKRFAHDDKSYNEGKSKYPAKYKGTLYLRIPNENSKKSMYPESDLRIFNDAIACIQASNPGYTWDWNEAGLKGLTVGFSVRQGTYNDSQFTKIFKLEDANDVRMGKVEVMTPMAPRSDAAEPVGAVYQPPATQQMNYTQVQTDELPF